MTETLPPKFPLTAWLLFGSGLLLTLFASFQVKQGIEKEAVARFLFACDQVTLKIEERLDTYALILRGGAGLFAASGSVDRQKWRIYVEKLLVDGSVPGVQGIGFAQVIAPNELDAHLAQIRSEGFPNYNIRPAEARNIYTSIIYLEPFHDRNLRAFGYDMFSEPIRRLAMEQARDTNKPSLSGKVELVQETTSDIQAGTLMYVPVYRNNTPTETVEERRTALIGWIYSPYRMNDLMTGVLASWVDHDRSKLNNLRIYDGTVLTPDKLLFDSTLHTAAYMGLEFHQKRTIEFNNRIWQLVFDGTDAMLAISYTPVWAALMGGLALSGLSFGLITAVIRTRTNALRIANELTKELQKQGELLRESEFRWKFAIDGSGDGLWDWDITNSTVFFSKVWKSMLGHTEEEIGNKLDEWVKRIHPEDKEATMAAIQACLDNKIPLYASEYRMLCKNGNYKWILSRGMVVIRSEDNLPLRMIGTHTDITERKQMEHQVRQLAFYDPLTRLPNRRLFKDRLGQAIANCTRTGLYGGVLYLDLDKFKPLNDTYGHPAGDLLLIEVAHRLQRCLRETDTVARFGGDEFVVMLNGLHSDKDLSMAQAHNVAEKIRVTLSEPYLINLTPDQKTDTFVEHHCTASIGGTLFLNGPADSQDNILQRADAAMYQAKEGGRNAVCFWGIFK